MNSSVCSAQAGMMKPWSHQQMPPLHHRREPSNLCQSDDAKQPFVVELGTIVHPTCSFQQAVQTLAKRWQRRKSRHSSEDDRNSRVVNNREKELWCN